MTRSSRREVVVALTLAVLGAVLLLSWWTTRPAEGFGRVGAAAVAPPVGGAPAASADAALASAPPGVVAVPPVGFRPAAPAPPPVVPVPRSLQVGDLRIDAPVVAVGVDEGGLLEIPADGDDVGWYRWSAVPGEPGTTVLAGHVDTVDDGPGALFPLLDAEPGTRVQVGLDDGTTREFTVTARQSFPKAALPVDVVFRRGGASELVLVTCSGPFDEETRSYEENIVVTATPLP